MRTARQVVVALYWLVAAVTLAPAGAARAESASAEDTNKSNNPLNPAIGANLQDIYTPELYGADSHTNDMLLRITMPLAPGQTIKAPQIFRLTAPISTRPDPDGGYTTGPGDLNLFDIFVLGKTSAGMEYGGGPLVVMPTASEDELGAGKWQAGLAAMAMRPSPQGIVGGLLQWQASFAGDDDRADVNTLTMQPFLIHNLPNGWYLRSTGIWTFDLENDNYFIPVGLGAGRAMKPGATTYNLFVEPQWTVLHDGAGVPQFSIFAGLNMTFGK
jgi:hypothetical protein